MKENVQRNLYLTERIRNMAYNTKYGVLRFFEEYDRNSLVQPNDQVYILGRKFTCNQNNLAQIAQEIREIFQNTPWLTYRSGFPSLPNELVGSYVSDTGWGCMVRVAQMLFAQVIKSHMGVSQKTEILNILSLFSDFDNEQPFSIQNVARLARMQYGLKPGDWYNPSQVSFILTQLHQQSLSELLKLKFIVFNSGNLFFDDLSKTMVNGETKCSCPFKSDQFICSKCNQREYSISVILLSRLGLAEPEKKYLTVLQKLMESQFCQGVIGGKPEKALYFVGKQNDHFIYLDPHYVHDASKDIKQRQQTYFCQSFRKCKSTSIDSSVGICFYLRDVSELNQFYKDIHGLRKENYEDFFIFVADKTPSYIKADQIRSVQISSSKDDVFQIL